MHKTVVINVVGLTPRLLGPATPNLNAFAKQGKLATIQAAMPAVTCTAQASYLTGVPPNRHGIVGNGWYFHDECEIKFWRQSNRLIQAPKIWEIARAEDLTFTCANLFWWFNMYSSADYTVTPRPMYPADGRKIPDIYTQPAGLRDELQQELGTFPLFDFWGPRTSIRCSQWIAEAAKRVEQKYRPTLTLIYLPHLDYNLQRLGPADSGIEQDLREIDAVCGDLFAYYQERDARIILLSEYGITDVHSVIHINRALREQGWLAVREELGGELLDAGASAAFAVADHQVAHIYVNDKSQIHTIRAMVERLDGVESVLGEPEKALTCLNHPRSGDLIAVARPDAWFSYYYWLDDRRAPDFARTVDIHRKPGYDPVELFLDPTLKSPALNIGWTLLKKRLGFRSLLSVIPLDASLVKGSHGRANTALEDRPLLITQQTDLLDSLTLSAIDICPLIHQHLGAVTGNALTQKARRDFTRGSEGSYVRFP